MRVLTSIVLAAITIAAPAASQSSNAARYLANKEVAEACNGGGRINPKGLIERDLTGDGRDDLIISHEWIECASGQRSMYCGMQVCSVNIYVREGKLLKLRGEFLGGGVSVGGGSRPKIEMYAHGGARGAIRWNGRSFGR